MQGFQYLSYYEKLNSFCQCILLDEDARVIDSCNSIFDVSIIADKPVYHTFDFFLGLYNSLYLNNPINTDIRFSKVNAPHPLLQGTYDFTFTNILVKHQHYLLWQIYDFTELYEHYKHYQQRKNELEIYRQKVELQAKFLNSTQEVLSFKDKIIDNYFLAGNDYATLAQNILFNPFYNLDDIAEILCKDDPLKDQLIVRLYETYKLFIKIADELLENGKLIYKSAQRSPKSWASIITKAAEILLLKVKIEVDDNFDESINASHLSLYGQLFPLCKIIYGLLKNNSLASQVQNNQTIPVFRLKHTNMNHQENKEFFQIFLTEIEQLRWEDSEMDNLQKTIVHEKLLRLFALKKIVSSVNGKILLHIEASGTTTTSITIPIVTKPDYSLQFV